MSRYVINILASRDLNDIADYFTENSLEAGDRFFRAFTRKCQQLVAFPNSAKPLYSAAFNLFKSREDKEWGLIDCVSFTVMQNRKMVDALTADDHFNQAGFRALLRG
jgi:predicted nucleic acid-binding protein